MTSTDPNDLSFVAELGSRALFPDLKAAVYANHAAISPPSIAVRHSVLEAIEDFGRHGADAFSKWIGARKRTKTSLGRLLSADADDIALVPNTTAGLNAIAMCFPWTAGDTVVVFKGEFPTNVTPWQQAAKAFDLNIHFLDLEPLAADGGSDLWPLEQALKAGVRLVAISVVQFQTGLRSPVNDIGALCHRYGAQLCVDGIQGVGALPTELQNVDYLAAGGHKWLMGLEGAGLLYIAPGRADELQKNLSGWLSHEDPLSFLFNGPNLLRYDRPIRKSADFLEGGALNTIGYAGLGASVNLLNQLGPEAIFAHIQAWHDALEPGLLERGFVSLRASHVSQRSGVLSVRPRADVDVLDLYAHLGHLGIACTTPDGYLRFAPHWPNGLDEADQILSAIDDYAPGR